MVMKAMCPVCRSSDLGDERILTEMKLDMKRSPRVTPMISSVCQGENRIIV
jgi:hypothetical protein